MAELAHFQNFAKLKDTLVEFNDITVLAGKPGTGKSYVMKFMYAIAEALHKLRKDVILNNEETQALKNRLDEILSITNPKKQLKELAKIQQELDVKKTFEYMSIANPQELYRLSIKNILNAVFTDLAQISHDFIVKYKDIDIKNVVNGLEVTTTIDEDTVILNNNIFVETPLILEFHKHLDRREAKTPYHIESLINILDEDYSFTDGIQDKLIQNFSQKSNNIIGGDIKNRNGSFVFSRNNDKDYNIFNASSGIKSIGLLQYLVSNKALKKGSVLFWEEPEVHLHPEWQLKMVDLFVELMNAGIKIVFSTHSPYMADYLNAISKKEGYRERISFNVLDEKDGVVTNHILNDDNWNILQSELMDTFEDILWQYL